MYFTSKHMIFTLAAVALLLVFSGFLEAQQLKHSDILPDDNPYIDDPSLKELFNQRPSERMMQQLQQDMGDFTGGVTDAGEQKKYSDGVFVFVSVSMGAPAIRSALELAVNQPVSLVFRGLEEGETIPSWSLSMQKIVLDIDPVNIPNVLLDPTLFTNHNITHVPTMILMKDGKQISKVSGSYNPDYLIRRQAEGRVGTLPPAGNILPIAEPDLLVQMQEKLADYDIDAAKRRSVANYWKKATFLPLPAAKQDETRYLDPTVEFYEDIISPDNRVVAKKGDRVNPLSLTSFLSTVYVFDVTNEAERKFVKEQTSNNAGSSIMITTTFDREGSWEGIVDVETQLEGPVYLLTRDVKDRFDVRVTPTVISAADNQFKITEHYVER